MEPLFEYFQNDLFARHAAIELVEVGNGHAVARMPLEDFHLNAVGTAHGGAIFTLADFAFAAASNSHGSVAMGISVSISYLRAVTVGTTLTAEATELSRSRRLGTYQVRVTDSSGGLVALFQGTVYRKDDPLPPKQTS